ncbi:MAG: helix-turn-helix transcriptional regulator, partial [Ruminiclostridium sp.]|nr:helix-turn-helix transcriptional regulator [Ruminiclostridium sp.]
DNMNIREFKELEEFKQKFFTMAVVHIETSKIDCYEDYTDFRRNRDRLKQKMLNYAMKENGVLICDNLKDSTELFVILNGNSKAAIHEIADNFLLRLYGLIVKDEAISITIGKSDIVDDISGFSLMYKHASSALDQRYKYGGNHIYFYSKTEKTEDIGTIQLLRSLAVCLDQDDLTKVKSGAKQIIEKIFSSDYLASRSKYEIQMLFNQIINEIVKFSLKHEVELNEHIKFEVISGEIISSFNRNKEFIEFLMKLLSDIIDRGSLSGIDTRTLIQFIKREIDRNFSRDITLDYISRKYGISSKYFSALFKKEVGMNFIDYLNQIRIEESKILLDGSEISISDIAESVGYKYIHYFYKLFKRMTGVTPMEYRNYRRK